MATKNKTKKREYVTSIPCIGPGVIRWCAKCGKAIEAGQHWQKINRGGYAVGVHDMCLAPDTKLDANAHIVAMNLRYVGLNADGIPSLEVQP